MNPGMEGAANMTPLEEQERFICSQLDNLREQYTKACEPWMKQLIYIRSLRPLPSLILSASLILSESEYKQLELEIGETET